uniref:Thrombomodulin n=1 Tax=Nothobranchius korthausae TaxID=1143690 RepID=A0A1A8F987_9TELE
MDMGTWTLLVLLLGPVGALTPHSGYCIGKGCFAWFRVPSDFRTAQSHCQDLGGHLMTVRTSVSNDVLSVLVGNVTGSFWIGLHRPSGCPEPAAKLNGFQWVTRDSESDFSNWLQNFTSSCSSERCVSVNGQDGFRWRPTWCDRSTAGFLCEFGSTEQCQAQAVGPGESVSYMIPYGFRVDDIPMVPLGSTATRFPSGTRSICSSDGWLPAPWSCEISVGGCEYRCARGPDNDPVCFCPPGRTVNPDNKVSCESPGPGDPCATRRCQQICLMDGACGCEHGFRLAEDGTSCVDFNECADERPCPGENVMCVNTPLRFKCACQVGFTSRRGLCVDRDECASAPCEHECVNTPGSYRCGCYDGYVVDRAAPDRCKLFCGKDECPAVCDPNDGRQCYCPDGYVAEERPDGTFCLEIDECAFSYCDQGCTNTFGGYACSCEPGFRLVEEYRCVKTDEEDPEEGAPSPDPTRLNESPPLPDPDPTHRPSAVTPGGLVGIIVCVVVLVTLLVFAAHLGLRQRGRKSSSASGPLPAAGEESHSLQRVRSHVDSF